MRRLLGQADAKIIRGLSGRRLLRRLICRRLPVLLGVIRLLGCVELCLQVGDFLISRLIAKIAITTTAQRGGILQRLKLLA